MPKYKRRPTLKTLITSQEDCPVEVSKKEYLAITEGFMQFIADKLLEGKDVDLPMKTGTLMVAGKKHKPKIDPNTKKIIGIPTNWKATLEYWKRNPEAKKEDKRIYYFNEHSSGNTYKFYWFNGYAHLNNKHLFEFKSTRANSRSLWQKIMSGVEYKLIRNPRKKTYNGKVVDNQEEK